jgi:hypothetical protein
MFDSITPGATHAFKPLGVRCLTIWLTLHGGKGLHGWKHSGGVVSECTVSARNLNNPCNTLVVLPELRLNIGL